MDIPDAEYDAAWVAEAYDSFADGLYAYCRSLVQEPAAAADAIRDTFVVTAFRLADLPEHDLLRAWLHAVARNECLRAIINGEAVPALDFLPADLAAEQPAEGEYPPGPGGMPPGPDETSPDLMATDPEDGQARALVQAALNGLDAAERDVMVLTWHGLDIDKCAAILGIAGGEAATILARGREQLEASAGVLVVARPGWGECAQLGAMIAGWGGRLTPALGATLRAHIDRCDLCGDQRRRAMTPAVLMRLGPDALRGTAAAAGASRLSGWVTSRLRDQVLAAAFNQEPPAFEYRATVVRQAGPFRLDGFPVPLDPPGMAVRRRRRSPVPLVAVSAGAAGLLVVAAVITLTLSGNHSAGALPAWTGLVPPSSARLAAGHGAASATRTATRSATSSPSPTPDRTPATALPTTQTPAASSGGPSSNAAPPAATRISVSPGSLMLTSNSGTLQGSLTLGNPTAGTVSWSIAAPGNLQLSQASGTLGPNASAQLSITYTGKTRHGSAGTGRVETITVEPGNVQVQVTIGSSQNGQSRAG